MSNTWLCTFEVKVDLPTDMTPHEMEALVAQCLAVRLPALGYAGNCIVSLTATAGNVSVLTMDATPDAVVRVDSPGVVGILPVPAPATIDPAPDPKPVAKPGPATLNPLGAV